MLYCVCREGWLKALEGRSGVRSGTFASSCLLLRTLLGRRREEAFGLLGRVPMELDWACSLLWRSSSSSLPEEGWGRVAALPTRSWLITWGELEGEFSCVEGGATPSPHLGGREGGLSRLP